MTGLPKGPTIGVRFPGLLPRNGGLSSQVSATLASKGMRDPSSLTFAERKSLAASALTQTKASPIQIGLLGALSENTSASVAHIAQRVLRSPETATPSDIKTLAGSVLTQRG